MKDMTREYNGFIIQNKTTGETIEYPYKKKVSSKIVEDRAIREQMNITGQPRSNFWVHGLIRK